jgi:hypothetical protein
MDQRELLGKQYHGSVRESEIHVRVFDIVDPQIVGSNELKLLRVVPFSSQGEDKHQARWEPIQKVFRYHRSTRHVLLGQSHGVFKRTLSGQTSFPKSVLKHED